MVCPLWVRRWGSTIMNSAVRSDSQREAKGFPQRHSRDASALTTSLPGLPRIPIVPGFHYEGVTKPRRYYARPRRRTCLPPGGSATAREPLEIVFLALAAIATAVFGVLILVLGWLLV
jgi:hypothetical protein